jgi:hypothetical protein
VSPLVDEGTREGKEQSMAKDQNTFAKRRREMEKKRKAEEKRERRRKKKEQADAPPETTPVDAAQEPSGEE